MKTKKSYIKILTLILLSFIVGCNTVEDKIRDENQELDLSGKWKFSIGDDSVWASPDYHDWDWEEIKVPSSWENEGFHGYNGFAWYRKSFELPAEYSNLNLTLHLGFIDDVDETYLNGNLVGLSGGFPPYFLTAFNASRKYFLPKHFLKDGKNLIAVRVYDSQLEGGIINGKIGIYKSGGKGETLTDLMPDVSLPKMWKFNKSDSLEWKEEEYDDSGWQNIFVPAFWETQGYKGYDGFAWYRTKFYLPEEYENDKFVLLLGKIDDIDQTFVNGKLVGSIGDWNFSDKPRHFNQNSEWETFRSYFISDNILKAGEYNTIAVRVYDGFLDGGIYEGPIGLITQERYRKFWKARKEVFQKFYNNQDTVSAVSQ
jgi:sialate O-acetylesterase